MPADHLRSLRAPERPVAALPALLPLRPYCGPPQAILRGAEGAVPSCCAIVGALLLCLGTCRVLLSGGLLPFARRIRARSLLLIRAQECAQSRAFVDT